ncbi:MAG: hypothetical protein WC867_02485 [Candidatus Pacearchaeota archaeon]
MKNQEHQKTISFNEEKLKQSNQPILKTSIRMSNDGKWLIHETIIVDIKPINYIEKCINSEPNQNKEEFKK